MIKRVISGFVTVQKKCVHHYTAYSFPVIVLGNNVFWASVRQEDPARSCNECGCYAKIASQDRVGLGLSAVTFWGSGLS